VGEASVYPESEETQDCSHEADADGHGGRNAPAEVDRWDQRGANQDRRRYLRTTLEREWDTGGEERQGSGRDHPTPARREEEGAGGESRQRAASNLVPDVGGAQPGKTLSPAKGFAGCRESETCHSVLKGTHQPGSRGGSISMGRARELAVGLMVLSFFAVSTVGNPHVTRAADSDPELTATLDGRPIPLQDVGRYYCDDFAYPQI